MLLLDHKILEFLEEEAKKLVCEKLALVGIDESLFERSPIELSGGQMRRGYSRYASHEANYFGFDEPTAGLDPWAEKN